MVLDRRATGHFTADPMSKEAVDTILLAGLQAPSGYNLQPWRFLVLRDEASRKKLQRVAFNQPKIAEAPVVIVAFGMKEEWKQSAREIFQEAAARGAGSGDPEKYLEGAIAFLSQMPMPVWVNRHTMIAFTTMMLTAEALGYDTAPMEGFDAAGIKREFGLPDEAEVVALLAIGRAREPDRVYPGRLDIGRLVFDEQYKQPWKTA